jgi:hypothetical protein
MRRLIAGVIVAAGLAVPATPAFAIHDGTHMPGATCSNPDSRAVGNNPNPGSPNLGVSNTLAGMAGHNKWAREDLVPPCHFGNLN